MEKRFCNNFNYSGCGSCQEGCKPAEYNSMFDIQTNPYDPLTWLVTINGMSHKVRIPAIGETDTSISTDQSNATLNYKAEKHRDTITGKQIGDLVNLGDLRDVNFDSGVAGGTYELVYVKSDDPSQSAWHNVSSTSSASKKDFMRHPRGTDVNGEPVFLDVPTDPDQFWYAGWRTDGDHKQFGYFKPKTTATGTLPTDENGNYIIASYDPETKDPIIGSLDFQTSISKVVASLACELWSTWKSVKAEGGGFRVEFNNVTGDFLLKWDNWRGLSPVTIHVGAGVINGKLNWHTTMDMTKGSIIYTVESIYFDTATWIKDAGSTPTLPPIKLTIKGVNMSTGAWTTILDNYSYTGNDSWSQTLHKTVPCDNKKIEILPSLSAGPFNMAYVIDHWVGDDEGYLGVNFKNKLVGW